MRAMSKRDILDTIIVVFVTVFGFALLMAAVSGHHIGPMP
jgi:preprotein translocase subunit SecE